MALDDLLTRDDLPDDVRDAIREEIATHKRSVEARRASEGLTQSLLASITDAFFSLDHDLVVTYFNPAAERLLGRHADEVLGRQLFEAFPEARGSIFEKKYRQALREKDFLTFETYFEVDPYRNWYDVRVHPRKDGISVFLQVTTQRKQAEEELTQHRARLEDLVEARTADLEATALELTERVAEGARSEEALRESEERYRLLADNASDVIWVRGLDLAVSYVSPSVERLRGFTPEEVLGQTLDEVMTPASARLVRETLSEELARVRTATPEEVAARALVLEVEMICKDGSTVWSEIKAKLLTGPDGRPSGILGISREISERKRAEEVLREGELLLRTTLESAPTVLFKLDTNGIFRLSTGAGLKGLGLKPGEVVGLSYFDLYKDLHEGIAYVRRALNGEAVSFVHEALGIVWEVHHSPMFGPDNEVTGIVGVANDISQRVRAEEALRVSEERFRVALRNSTITVYTQDTELRYTWVYNPHYRLDADSMLGKADSDLVSPEDAVPLTAMKRRVLESGSGTRQTIRFTVEGKPRFHDLTLEPLRDSEGRTVGITGISNDITERRRAEEEHRSLEVQVQHAQKLESLGVLAGGVAHDFNNLLVGMLGHSDLALSKLPPENAARPNIEGVMQAAERAADLSRQMLAYSGHGHFIVQPTDVGALVRENVHLLKAGIAKGVQLRTRLCDTPAVIEADVGQMQQIIMNLVLNGAEAIGDRSGYVTISTGFEALSGEEARYSRFTATELTAGRYVFLEVRDDGPGMDEETVSKVFDPFFTTKFVGRGLGLSALLGIVRGHKGGIDVRSGLGKGTTFRLVFPETEEAPESTKGVTAEGRLEGTILVIDDEEIVRTMTSEMLTPQGLTVMTAEGGAAGVALFEERHAEIGLILLDYSMPEMGGEETFQQLRKLKPDVPVLLSSGFGQEEATRRFEGRDLTGFIQKPYRLATLLAEIRRCLSTPLAL